MDSAPHVVAGALPHSIMLRHCLWCGVTSSLWCGFAVCANVGKTTRSLVVLSYLFLFHLLREDLFVVWRVVGCVMQGLVGTSHMDLKVSLLGMWPKTVL